MRTRVRISYNKRGDARVSSYLAVRKVVRIGSEGDNDIVLRDRSIAKRAAVLSLNGNHWELTTLGESDVKVGDYELRADDRVIVSPLQPITIGWFSLRLEDDDAPPVSSDRDELDTWMSRIVIDLHRDLLARMGIDLDESNRSDDQYLLRLERDLEELARLRGFLDAASGPVRLHCAALSLQSALLNRVIEGESSKIWNSDERWRRLQTEVADLENELNDITKVFEGELALHDADTSRKIARIEATFWSLWATRESQLHGDFVTYLALRNIKKQIKDILFGYGPLEDLIRLPNISEIMVVSRDKIYVEKNGVLEQSGRRFVSDEVTVSIIERIVSRVGRRIDKSQPLVDARLLDGSRVNAVISPLALSGPCLTIRKFPSRKLTVDDLVNRSSLTRIAADFLKAAVVSGRNILISGGTGTGKTTMLNCLSDFIPSKERIVTIEDTAELQLHKEHVVRLETKLANVEGAGEYTIRDLVRNALRMRPDRVVVGECRGPEALDMLQAMNTGHDGSMTTIHANTSEDVIGRLEILVQMAADLPIESIQRQIASAIDLVVQLNRMRDGSRRVTQITEFVEYDQLEKRIRTKDLFCLDGTAGNVQLMPTGCLPSFMGDLIADGHIHLDAFYR